MLGRIRVILGLSHYSDEERNRVTKTTGVQGGYKDGQEEGKKPQSPVSSEENPGKGAD